jgi:hypothetical protein
MPEGWIKLHRRITENWLYKEPRVFSRFEAWIYLILSANHKDNKFMLGSRLIEVKRGGMAASIEGLGALWGWSATKVKNFLEDLKRDGMIDYTSSNRGTVISLTNYSLYQDLECSEKLPQARQENTKDNSDVNQKYTNNNDKECIKNEKKIKYAEFVTMTNAEYEKLVGTYGEEDARRMISVLDNYKGSSGRKYKSDYRAILNWAAKKVLDEKGQPVGIPNAGAYKPESKKCPLCSDTGWVKKDW